MGEVHPDSNNLDSSTAASDGSAAPTQKWLGRHRQLAGDSVVARLLCATAFVFIGVVGLAAWQAHDAIVASRRQAVACEVESAARLLSAAIKPLASTNELSNLRRLVTDLANQSTSAAQFEEICISLPDGSVVAHSQPSRINARALPEHWTAAPLNTLPSSTINALEVVTIPQRGPLHILVRAKAPEFSVTEEAWVLSLCAAGLAGAGALTLIYLTVRKRLRVLGLIGDALRDLKPEKSELSHLQLDERFGPEAKAFNQLISAANQAAVDIQSNGSRAAGSPTKQPENTLLSQTGQDVPARSATETELEEAVHLIPVGVLTLDRQARVRHANSLGATLAGSTVTEITGLSLEEILADPVIEELAMALRQGKASRRTLEVRRETTTGVTVLRIQCRPFRKDDGGSALLTLEDVTQQRLADASRNLFIAQATHELRTPLTNMRLAVEMVMEEHLPENIAPHLNMLSSEVRRLERLVGDMLAVSEIEAGSMKLTRSEIQIERLVADIEADHRQQAEQKKITFSVVLPPKLPQLFGDREKVLQAIHNLIGNAIKYTPDGGSVTVTLSTDPRGVIFTIADTGYGISQADQEKLFTRFARGSDPRVAKITGTGLGLALSREIARLHGGDITLTSEPDKGSTFTLIIPQGRSDRLSQPMAA